LLEVPGVGKEGEDLFDGAWDVLDDIENKLVHG
jgi:hypothetical protein